MTRIRLVSWNVNGRVRRIDDQIATLKEQRCDVIALQEVTQTTVPWLRTGLQRIGFPYVVDSFASSKDKSVLVGPRRYGELIACRWPLRSLPPERFNVPWPERILSVAIHYPSRIIYLHTTHIPPGSTNGWTKIEMLEGIYERLACRSRFPRVLCGDFNTPQEETSDGKVITWGRGRTRWDMGERNILEGLTKFDLVDVFRFRYGYNVQEYSWYARPHIGRRFDHVFASRLLLNDVECDYLHAFREERLSDHSAIRVDFKMHSV